MPVNRRVRRRVGKYKAKGLFILVYSPSPRSGEGLKHVRAVARTQIHLFSQFPLAPPTLLPPPLRRCSARATMRGSSRGGGGASGGQPKPGVPRNINKLI